jgi:hypothetical protein
VGGIYIMRKMLRNDRTLGSIHISEIEFDLNCRHEIIPILMALQSIYGKPKLLKKISSCAIRKTIMPLI